MLNATEDVSNFFEGSSHLSYLRCPIKVRASPRMPMPPSVASWCRRRIAPRAFASHDRVPFDKRQDRSDAAAEMAAHFPAAVEFINSAREANGEHSLSSPRRVSWHVSTHVASSRPPCSPRCRRPGPRPLPRRRLTLGHRRDWLPHDNVQVGPQDGAASRGHQALRAAQLGLHQLPHRARAKALRCRQPSLAMHPARCHGQRPHPAPSPSARPVPTRHHLVYRRRLWLRRGGRRR